MPNNIQVEQMRLSEKDDLLAFLREAYRENPRMSDEKFWDWHFLENPYVSPDDLPVWIAKCEGRIAGQLAATPVDLKIGAEQKRAIWILDLIVHDDFRRRGIASRLVREAERFCPVGLGINTTEQHSTEVLENLGWRVLGKIPRYSKMLFAGNVLPEISRIKPLRGAFNILSAPFRTRLDRSPDGLKIIEKFGADFDELWREASTNWNCAVARERRFLEWQFAAQSGKKFEIVGYFEEGKLRGYAVVFVRKPDKSGAIAKASIADLCYHPKDSEEIVDRLLRGALEIAVSRRAGSLVTDVLDPLAEARLLRLGFRHVKVPCSFL